MLTEEDLAERKWGNLPALRKLLESKRLDTNVSDYVCESLRSTLEIVLLICDFETDIKTSACRSEDAQALFIDLQKVRTDLRDQLSFVIDTSGKLEHVLNSLDRALWQYSAENQPKS